MGEFKVGRSTRRCFTLDRPLREGEVYYSVVLEQDDGFVRRDYSAEAWTGPPEEAIGHWKNRMPTSEQKKWVIAPPEVLIDLLRTMADVPGKESSRFLLALMLLRRRLIRPAAVASTGPLQHYEVVADSSPIDVLSVTIRPDEIESLQSELTTLLYCEAVSDEATDD